MSEDKPRLVPPHDNVNDLLGVKTVLMTPEKVILQVEVGPNVHQPYGILHGGVSALLAEGANVIDAGGVDEEHWADGQQFHRFLDRVGGCAGHVGDDGDRLLGDGVQQA